MCAIAHKDMVPGSILSLCVAGDTHRVATPKDFLWRRPRNCELLGADAKVTLMPIMCYRCIVTEGFGRRPGAAGLPTERAIPEKVYASNRKAVFF